MFEIEKNYSIFRRVYQCLFVDVPDTFIQYIYTLYLDEIEQLDNDLKVHGWGVKSVVEIEDSVAVLCIFQIFYHCNKRLPLTNGLLVVPDGEIPSCSEKISLKFLYEMFKDTKSHGLVLLQFLSALNIFFGWDIGLSKLRDDTLHGL